jgi:hypothetical protein
LVAPCCCKPLAEINPEDLVFYNVPIGSRISRSLRGCKSSRAGHLFEDLGFNRLADVETEVPDNAVLARNLGSDGFWRKRFFFDSSKIRLVADESKLPDRFRFTTADMGS